MGQCYPRGPGRTRLAWPSPPWWTGLICTWNYPTRSPRPSPRRTGVKWEKINEKSIVLFLVCGVFQSDYKHIDFLWDFAVSRDLEAKIFILQMLRDGQWPEALEDSQREIRKSREIEDTEEVGCPTSCPRSNWLTLFPSVLISHALILYEKTNVKHVFFVCVFFSQI